MPAERRRVVLVVEDDLAVRRPLEKFLEIRGFKAVTADSADEALNAIGHYRPSAAIVDLRLTRGSGRDVIVSMAPGVPVIIFSGVPSESCELERLRPRTRLIAKPYSLVLLVETLEQMLASADTTLQA
jgi:two-component system, response regulator RegA